MYAQEAIYSLSSPLLPIFSSREPLSSVVLVTHAGRSTTGVDSCQAVEARLVGAVNLGHVAQEIEHTTAVAPLVVVPGDELDEVVVKADAGLGIKDGGVGVAVEVGGDNVVLAVLKDAWKTINQPQCSIRSDLTTYP